MTNNYVVAAINKWNLSSFNKHSIDLEGNWYFVGSPKELSSNFLKKIQPRYIFFPHWSWIVPSDIIKNFECICFHMTDLPYGRGGSPLQNLIARGHKDTKLTAFRMVDELDAGPIYGKMDLSLEGSAQAIFERAAELVYDLIRVIVNSKLEPQVQKGETVLFERRTPVQSKVPLSIDLNQLFDHIRMLDAEFYPHAYIEHGNFKLEFTKAKKEGEELTCNVKISKRKK